MKTVQYWVWTLMVAVAMACGGGDGGTQNGEPDSVVPEDTPSPTCPYNNHYKEQPCNPLCPDSSGCAAGESCTVGPAGFLGCVSDGQSLGMGCNDETLCKEGLCLELEVDGKKCRPFCVGDVDCPDGGLCGAEMSVGSLTFGLCTPPPPSCNVFEQDCVGQGMACVLGDGDTICMEAGQKTVNEACDAVNDCIAGLICVSDKCHEPCNPKTGGPEPKCHLKCPGSTGEVTDEVAVCSLPDDEPSCDLLSQDCEQGEACVLTGQGPRCRNAGSVAVGEDCSEEGECVKGAVCWPQGTQCKAICNPDEKTHAECENRFGTPCAQFFPGLKGGFCDE